MRLSGVCAGESGVLFMDLIAEIRRRHLVSKESISAIARDLNLSRPTVRKHCRTQRERFTAVRSNRRRCWAGSRIAGDLVADHQGGAFPPDVQPPDVRVERQSPKAQRRTARRLFTAAAALLHRRLHYRGRPDTRPRRGRLPRALRVSSTCLVVLDRNRTAFRAFAVRAVSVRSTANDSSSSQNHADQLPPELRHVTAKRPSAAPNGSDRARIEAQTNPVVRYRRPADRRTRPQRWQASAKLIALQAEYIAWAEACLTPSRAPRPPTL